MTALTTLFAFYTVSILVASAQSCTSVTLHILELNDTRVIVDDPNIDLNSVVVDYRVEVRQNDGDVVDCGEVTSFYWFEGVPESWRISMGEEEEAVIDLHGLSLGSYNVLVGAELSEYPEVKAWKEVTIALDSFTCDGDQMTY